MSNAPEKKATAPQTPRSQENVIIGTLLKELTSQFHRLLEENRRLAEEALRSKSKSPTKNDLLALPAVARIGSLGSVRSGQGKWSLNAVPGLREMTDMGDVPKEAEIKVPKYSVPRSMLSRGDLTMFDYEAYRLSDLDEGEHYACHASATVEASKPKVRSNYEQADVFSSDDCCRQAYAKQAIFNGNVDEVGHGHSLSQLCDCHPTQSFLCARLPFASPPSYSLQWQRQQDPIPEGLLEVPSNLMKKVPSDGSKMGTSSEPSDKTDRTDKTDERSSVCRDTDGVRPPVSSRSRDVTAGYSLAVEAGVGNIFPRWFNPYLQDTYLGDRRHSIDIAHVLKMSADTGLEGWESVPSSCILKPLAKTRLIWDFIWSWCLAFEIWITPIDLVYVETGYMPTGLDMISAFTMVFFMLDIGLNFFTGYMSGEKEILNRRLIVMNYLKTWFFFDVVATIPWDVVGGAETASTSRAARMSKVLKMMKMARLLRLVKLHHQIQNVKRVRKQRAIDYVMNTKKKQNQGILERLGEEVSRLLKPFRPLLTPLQLCMVLVLLAHAHSPFIAVLREDWSPARKADVIFERYYESFWWAFSKFTFGNPPGFGSPGAWTLEICVSLERFLFAAHVMQLFLFHALMMREDDAKKTLRNSNAMAYLRQHDVSVKTQVQVLLSVNETGGRRKLHRNFLELVEEDLPHELQQRLSTELWSKRLTGLALIGSIDEWREDFVGELAQLVAEETYASKILIFKEGDAAGAAYLVLVGALLVTSSFQDEAIPPFTKGQWVGERALVNPSLRRSGSCITKSVTTLMVVPARGFQDLLEKQGLLDRFQQFCSAELWKGFCGRCGLMGDHFGHECPALFMRRHGRISSLMSAPAPDHSKGHLARDLRMYLEYHRLKRIRPALEKVGIETLDQLDEPEARTRVMNEIRLTTSELKLVGSLAIQDFKQKITSVTLNALSAKLSGNHHFVFLSHYKLEAGTEASLMRAELEHLIQEDSGHPAQGLEAAIFLDSEDLSDLSDLMKACKKSHNLVLMLTKGVLTRPWCILEIAVSVRDDVNIVPVRITKPDAEFRFPDESFYKQLIDGEILGEDGTALVESHGFSMAFVVRALKRVFKRIALPYSPHRAGAIRRAELQALLRQCGCRVISDERTSTGNFQDALARSADAPVEHGFDQTTDTFLEEPQSKKRCSSSDGRLTPTYNVDSTSESEFQVIRVGGMT